MAKSYLPDYCLRMLYYSLINPHLLYGYILWGSSRKKYISKLNIMQKKAVRAVTHSKYTAHTSPLFKKINILKLEDLHQSELAKFHYMSITNTLPIPLQNMFYRNCDVHSYNTRQQHDVHLDTYKSDLVFRSFISKSPDVWSKLPIDIKEAKSIHSLGSRIKKHFISHY